MRIVIIGGGTAGISTATKLRRLSEENEIIILEKDNEFAVSLCALPYYLAGIIKDENSLSGTTPEEMKNKYNIEVRLNNEVESIDRKEKIIKIINREQIYYDKLVIACGSVAAQPKIKGVLNEKVFPARSAEAFRRIKNFITKNRVKNALVAGGGHIGIEVAEALMKSGIKTAIAEASFHLLPALDYDMASLIHNVFRRQGAKLYLGQAISEFGAKTVLTSHNREIPYDIAIYAVGVRPDNKIAAAAGLETGIKGGLKVNERMQTSDSDIYAAGDITETLNLITRKPMLMTHAGIAIKQARIAAENLSGKKEKISPMINTSATPVFDYTAAAAGANEKILSDNKIAYHKIHVWSPSSAKFLPGFNQMLLKILFSPEGEILGVEGIGKNGIDKRIDVIAEIIRQRGSLTDLIEAEIAYAPAYAAASDAVNYLGSLGKSILEGKLKPVYPEEIEAIQHMEDFEIVDVRPKEQFDHKHIPGAINLPLIDMRGDIDRIPTDKKLVLYCNRGYGAYNANCLLANRGFENVYFLSGGMDLYDQITEDKENSDF